MTPSVSEIRVQDIDHCALVAGIIDQMCLVEKMNQILGTHHQEIVSPGQAVKAMIINGLGLVSAPLYKFIEVFCRQSHRAFIRGRYKSRTLER
jgi:hypothetical protein